MEVFFWIHGENKPFMTVDRSFWFMEYKKWEIQNPLYKNRRLWDASKTQTRTLILASSNVYISHL